MVVQWWFIIGKTINDGLMIIVNDNGYNRVTIELQYNDGLQ